MMLGQGSTSVAAVVAESPLVLAIDIGSSSTKVRLYDGLGAQ